MLGRWHRIERSLASHWPGPPSETTLAISVEHLSKLAGAVAILAYGFGMLIVNVYLLDLDLTSPSFGYVLY